MAVTKATLAVKFSTDAEALMAQRGVADTVQAALQLLPEYFSGATEVNVESYAEPEERAEPHLSFEIDTPLDRAAFRHAITAYFSHLRRENNPIHLYLAIVKR